MTQENSYLEEISLPRKQKYISVFLFIVFFISAAASILTFIYSHIIATLVLALFSLLPIFFFLYLKIKNALNLVKCHKLFENIALPILWLDCNGRIIAANPAFLKWNESDKLFLIGKKLFDGVKLVFKKDSNVDLWKEIESYLQSNNNWVGEVAFQRADARYVELNLTVIPIYGKKKKQENFIVQFEDKTELKERAKKIEDAQKQYRSIVESALDGIIVIKDGLIEFVNPAAVKLFGYTASEEMKKIKFIDTLAVQSRQSFTDRYKVRELGTEVLRNYEMRALTKSGKIIDLEVNAIVIEWNNQPAVQASFRDITERKMLEREQAIWLWEQETLSEIDRKLAGIIDLREIFLAILQQTLNLTRAHFSGVLLIDDATGELEWKAIRGNTFHHELGYFAPNATLLSILKNIEPLAVHQSKNNNYSLSEVPVLAEEKLESTLWLPLQVENKLKGMLVIGYRHSHDFSGREMRLLNSLAEKHTIAMVNTKLYTDLLKREKELEILSGAHVQAQEEERRRIAREIHDGLGQMLTAIKFNLEMLEDIITIGEEQRERIDDMKNLLDSVMKEAREISYNLMPSVLEDFGLAPALQLLSEQFSNLTGIKINYLAQGLKERLEPNMEVGLYRIAQESLNNIAKHAEATEVNLQIIRYSDGVRLMVEDNGKGISIKIPAIMKIGKNNMGLVNMRERASSMGGNFLIDSMPEHGTVITVEIPLINENKNE